MTITPRPGQTTVQRVATCVLLLAATAAAEDVPARFTRFVPEDLEGRLETAEVALVSTAARAEVVLVGAIHVAERGYYEALQRDLDGRDAVFFEGVTGSFEPVDATIAGYKRLGARFQLVAQRDVMQRGPTWIHADMSLDELVQALGSDALSGEFPAKEAIATLEALLARQPSNEHVKWALAERLGESGVRTELRHITVRNERCFQVTRAELARRGGGRFAILYGAAHMPDLARRLMEAGFAPVRVEWRTAWRISQVTRTADAVNAVVRAVDTAEAERERRQWIERGVLLVAVVVGFGVLWRLKKAARSQPPAS